MSTLGVRILAQLQTSSGSNTSSVAALSKALNEPQVFVRFALERLRDQGVVIRRGGWWLTEHDRASAEKI
jgi:DNA-binding IscR family transcriptional regulator